MLRAPCGTVGREGSGADGMLRGDFQVRFAGLARLLGEAGLERLARARVLVVGLGGVGSWVVEALARSGIGGLTLVDLDEVCLSNVNRQLPALDGTVGRFKAEVLAERVRAIHPGCEVVPEVAFFTAATEEALLGAGHDAVVDAIDAVSNKARLIAGARARGVPLVVCGAAGGRLDPTQVRIQDLSRVTHDRLLAEVRRRLRRDHGFPAEGRSMKVPAVFSPETPRQPERPAADCAGAEMVVAEGSEEGRVPPVRRLNCDWGYGSASFVTGAFGLAAAAWVVRTLAGVGREEVGVRGPGGPRRSPPAGGVS